MQMMMKQVKNKQAKPQNQIKNSIPVEVGILEKIENFLSKYSNLFLGAILVLSMLFSFLIFDFNVSVGGDDSAYIERAYDFYHNSVFPGFQGPLYPILLSPFIGIFGLNLIVLKLISLVFLISGIFLLYNTFKNKIPFTVLIPGFLIFTLSWNFLYYGSQTYSETLFFLLQAIVFNVMFKNFTENNEKFSFKKDIKAILLLSFVLFVSIITKNIAYASVIAVFLFLIITKQYVKAGITAVILVGFNGLWGLVRKTVWAADKLQVSEQGAKLLLKNPYDPNQGNEDISGYLQRFWDNTQIYLSKRIFEFTGWRPNTILPEEITALSGFLGILVLILFGAALFFVFNKNKYLLFTVIYTIIMYGITFIVLQKIWDSGRLIITLLPFTVLSIFGGLYYFSKSEKISFSFAGFTIILSVILLSILNKINKANEAKLIEMKEKTGETFEIITEQHEIFSASLLKFFLFVFVPIIIFLLIIAIKKYSHKSEVIKQNIISGFNSFAGFFVLAAMFFTLISTFGGVIKKAETHSEIRKKNLAGDMLAGFTPDWKNYINMCKFAAENIPDSAGIACRKPDIAFIYTGRKFLGIYNVPSQDGDTLLGNLKEMKADYIILGSLRKYEERKTEYTINTIERYIYPIQQKYPDIFKIAHKIGADESATLIKVDYPAVVNKIDTLRN